jgi:simple sugar transport system ATP-binding protein
VSAGTHPGAGGESDPTPAAGGAPILEARDIVKTFGHVHALRGANFSAYAGEVVALIGDNGAGKSTLTKVISGVTAPDSGELLFEGRVTHVSSPAAAQQLGIETVYQDLSLAPDLDGSANIFLGREIYRPGVLGRLGVLDRGAMREGALTAFTDLGVAISDPDVAVGYLSGGQRQGVAVARAASWASKVIIMDEPTAALGVVQSARVLDVIRRVRDRGLTVVLISHNMPEVLDVADRIEVLRLGERVASFTRAQATLESLVGAMTGAYVQETPPSAGPVTER